MVIMKFVTTEAKENTCDFPAQIANSFRKSIERRFSMSHRTCSWGIFERDQSVHNQAVCQWEKHFFYKQLRLNYLQFFKSKWRLYAKIPENRYQSNFAKLEARESGRDGKHLTISIGKIFSCLYVQFFWIRIHQKCLNWWICEAIKIVTKTLLIFRQLMTK